MLLFVFWYCHKRGKEVRLENERRLTEEEVRKLDVEYQIEHPGEVPTTTAATGASMEEVRAGVKEVEAAKAKAKAEAEAKAPGLTQDAVPEKPVDPALVPPTTVP